MPTSIRQTAYPQWIMRVLVNGYIGAVLSRLLMASGHQVIGADGHPARAGGLPTLAPVACPHCGSKASAPFYEWPDVPDGNFLLVNDSHAALDIPGAPFRLHWCQDCGHVFNAAWEVIRSVHASFIKQSMARR